MQPEPIRVGIIGAGQNTRARHIPGLRRQDGVAIAAVSNRTLASGRRAAAECDIPRVAAHWREIAEAPDVDAVVIGTWPYLHCAATVAALEAGKHVMCEARMAMNAQEARRMYQAAQRNPQLTAQIVPSPMTLGVDKTIQRLIREGYLGDLLVVDVQAGGEWLDAEAPLHWRHDMDRSGFNIMTMGIWYEALLRWAGAATAVAAMGKTFVTQRYDAEAGRLRGVRVPEHVDIAGALACGAQLHMQISAVTGHAGAPRATLYGSQGTIQFSGGALRVGRRDDPDLQAYAAPAAEAGGWRVEEEFVNAIRGLEPVTHTDFATGVKYMEFTEAVTRSMQTGRTVALPLA